MTSSISGRGWQFYVIASWQFERLAGGKGWENNRQSG